MSCLEVEVKGEKFQKQLLLEFFYLEFLIYFINLRQFLLTFLYGLVVESDELP